MEYFSQYNESNPAIETARSQYEFTTWWHDFISGRAEIRPKPTANDELKGSAFIYKEKNSIIKFGSSVRPLSRIAVTNPVVQDTYVTTRMPSVSFGDSTFIKIGTDKDNKYRSLIAFDISETKDRYVTKANLVLYSQEKRVTTLNIALADKYWKENSIIWNQHPSVLPGSPIIKVTFDGTNINRFKVDLKPFIKYYQDNSIDPSEFNGLILYTDITEPGYKTFISKEYSDQLYRPYFELEYLDPDTYMSEDERIEGRAIIHGSRTNNDVLKAKAYIDRDDLYSKIKCRAIIKPEKIDAKAAIIGMNNILKAKANIGFEDCTLKGRAEIYGYNIDDTLKAKVIIPQDKIKARVDISAFNNGIQGKALINAGNIGFTGISNIIGYSNTKLECKAKIVYEEKIECTASVIPCVNINAKAKIIANNSINVKSNILASNSISSTATIVTDTIRGRLVVGDTDNSLKAISNIYATSGISAKVSIISESKGINGKAIIQNINDGFIGTSNISAINNINAKLSIISEIKAFDGKAMITELIVNDDLKATARLAIINDLLKSKSNILAMDDINAKASISIVNDELKAKLNIEIFNEILAKSSIINYKDCITSELSIISNNDELICKAIIELDDDIYCFIM